MALTIRIRPDQEELIEKLKAHFGVGSSAKALLMAADVVVNKMPLLVKDKQYTEDAYESISSKHEELILLLRQKQQLEVELEIAIT